MDEFFLSTNSLRVHMQQFITALAQQFEMHGQELVFIMAIDNLGNPTVGELSKELQVRQANVSKMIRALETKGIITKTRDAKDSRSYQISLSEAAIKIKEEIKNSMRSQYQAHQDSIDVELMKAGVGELIKFISLFEDGVNT